jgi:hypothetical protein
MSDPILAYLNTTFASHKQGLVYEFPSYHTTRTTLTTSSVDIEVRKAVTHALDVCAIMCKTADRTLATVDSFNSIVLTDADSVQWRIGSHYLPSSPTDGVVENYAEMLYRSRMLRESTDGGLRLTDFKGTGASSPGVAWPIRYGMFCMSLQRNAILDLSGLAINNSTTLSINGTVTNADSSNAFVFLRHVRRAVCFMESLTLET